MIEKGKGLMINKLQIIQLIEGDLQILTRIFINIRNKSRIESDNRISKCNYGLRVNYFIENAILEKQLVYDNSILIGNITIHNMTDLKSYYDRQLAQMRLIIKESISIE